MDKVNVSGVWTASRATSYKRIYPCACIAHHTYLSDYISMVFDIRTVKRDTVLERPSGMQTSITLLFVLSFHLIEMPMAQTCIRNNNEQKNDRSCSLSTSMNDLIVKPDEASLSTVFTTVDTELHSNALSDNRQCAQTLHFQWLPSYSLSSSQSIFTFTSNYISIKHHTHMYMESV